MGMPPPDMAKTETILVRYVKQFHEKFIERLSTGSKETLRSAAWQLDALIEENKKFKDAEYLKTMLSTIEWVIQKQFGGDWTVAKAKKDLRGRTKGINQFSRDKSEVKKKLPMPEGLKRALEARLKS